jgi:hypothetical protein
MLDSRYMFSAATKSSDLLGPAISLALLLLRR